MTVVPLDAVATIHGGGRLKLSGKNFVASGVPAYGAAGRNGFVARSEHERDGIILSSIGARCGKCFLVSGRWTSLANTQVILPDAARVDVRFLWRQLDDESRWHRSGSAQPFIKPSDVKAHQIWLPSLDEQRRIVAILDRADSLVETQRAGARLREGLVMATYTQMFASGEWAIQPLGQLLDFLTSGSRGWAKYYRETGHPFLRVQNVIGGRLDFSDMAFVDAPDNAEARRTRVRPGDVLLSITADLGRVAVVPESMGGSHVNQHLSILRSSSISPFFLSAYLASAEGQAQIRARDRGQTKAGLNFNDIRSLAIPVPPPPLQAAFADRLDKIEAGRRQAEKRWTAMREMKSGLRVRAFSGQL